MFLKNCWYVAAELTELSRETPLARTVIKQPLALYLDTAGQPVVFEDRCCHRWAALSLGRVEGDDLRCMYHGFKYDSSGRCIEIPGQTQIPEGACVRRYAATARYGWVWVWMGEAATADLSLIPTAPGADAIETEYDGFTSQMIYGANYELINDNLTDFSHLSYVHSSSFGASLEIAHKRPKVMTIDRGVRIQRWVMDDQITPRMVPELAGLPLCNWTSIDYIVPGILLMIAEVHLPEVVAAADGGPPTGIPLHAQYNWQAVTPIDETSSRYYFGNGIHKREGRPHLTPVMQHVLTSAFAEDKAMLENQQRVWTKSGAEPMFGSTADVGLHRFRRTIQRLIEVETEQAAASASAGVVMSGPQSLRVEA